MVVADTLKELEQHLNEAFDHYMKLHEELNPYRGRSLELDEIPVVNKILEDIQQKFSRDLYPIYHFIALHHQSAVNATNEFSNFIDSLKKSGATQNKPDTPQE